MRRAAAIRTTVEHEKFVNRTTQIAGRRSLMLARYELHIAGRLDETAAAAFAGLEVTVRDSVTTIRGEFDQASLHGALERIRVLGLDLIEALRVRAPPAGRAD